MTYTSDEFFHFVGRPSPNDHDRNYLTLCKILNSGFVTHKPHRAEWGPQQLTYDPSCRLLDAELVVGNMVCFCDIPKHLLSIHVKKYGYFGLSLKRTHLVKYGARPVLYFPYDPADIHSIYGVKAIEDIEAVYRSASDALENIPDPLASGRNMGRPIQSADGTFHTLAGQMGLHFLALLKPFDSTLTPDHPENYYMEREWRRIGNMKFDREQIGCILVPRDYVDRLCHEFPMYADVVEAIEVSIGP